ncbi:hypothetical protein TIFTF001_031703 [Ficus carica]|uniref:Uncharacterized protein n=1 Tax=Ficus carica TaxID=3494 RepID=A0AA88DY14_FICCA|nr:hypothetical protein TIFTF001_031703 [Ficus carica]
MNLCWSNTNPYLIAFIVGLRLPPCLKLDARSSASGMDAWTQNRRLAIGTHWVYTSDQCPRYRICLYLDLEVHANVKTHGVSHRGVYLEHGEEAPLTCHIGFLRFEASGRLRRQDVVGIQGRGPRGLGGCGIIIASRPGSVAY